MPTTMTVSSLLSFSYYLKAIQLYPKSGRPYNQLAVIAVNAVSQPTHMPIHYHLNALCLMVDLSRCVTIVTLFRQHR